MIKFSKLYFFMLLQIFLFYVKILYVFISIYFINALNSKINNNISAILNIVYINKKYNILIIN